MPTKKNGNKFKKTFKRKTKKNGSKVSFQNLPTKNPEIEEIEADTKKDKKLIKRLVRYLQKSKRNV